MGAVFEVFMLLFWAMQTGDEEEAEWVLSAVAVPALSGRDLTEIQISLQLLSLVAALRGHMSPGVFLVSSAVFLIISAVFLRLAGEMTHF